MLASYLSTVERKSLDESKSLDFYVHVLESFWKEVDDGILQAYLDSHDPRLMGSKVCSAERREKLTEYLSSFFRSFSRPEETRSTQKVRKTVKFEDEGDRSLSMNPSLPAEKPTKNENFLPLLESRTQALFFTVKFCYEIGIAMESLCELQLLRLLTEITVASKSTLLLKKILSLHEISESGNPAPVVYFKEFIFKWMQEAHDDEPLLFHLADMVFYLCSCAGKDNDFSYTLAILEQCCQLKNNLVLKTLLARGTSSESRESLLYAWLKDPRFGKCVIDSLKEATSILLAYKESSAYEEVADNLNNVYAYVEMIHEGSKKGSVLSTSDEHTIVCTLKDSLNQCCSEDEKNITNLHELLNLTSKFFITLCEHNKLIMNLEETHDLLAFIFHAYLRTEEYQICGNVHNSMMNAWLMATSCLRDNTSSSSMNVIMDNNFLYKCAKEFHKFFLCQTTLTEKSSSLLESGLKLLYCAEEAAKDNPQIHITSILLPEILPTEEEWQNFKEELDFNILPAFLTRKIFYPWHDEARMMIGSSDAISEIPRYILLSATVSEILSKKVKLLKTEFEKNEMDAIICCHVENLLWSFAYCENNDFLKHEESEKHVEATKLKNACFELMSFLSPNSIEELLQKLYIRSLAHGLKWALTLQTFVEIVHLTHHSQSAMKLEVLVRAVNGLDQIQDKSHCYITAQMLIPYLSMENKVWLIEYLTTEIEAEGMDLIDNGLGLVAELCCCLLDGEMLNSLDDTIELKLLNCVRHISLACKEKIDDPIILFHFNYICSALVKYRPSVCEEYLPIFAESLRTTIELSIAAEEPKVEHLLLFNQVCSLLTAISSLIGSDEQNVGGLFSNKALWKMNKEEMYGRFVRFFFHAADESIGRLSLSPTSQERLFSGATAVLAFIPPKIFFDTLIKLHEEEEGIKELMSIPDSIHAMLETIAPYLTENRSLQLASRTICQKLLSFYAEHLKSDKREKKNEDSCDSQVFIKSMEPILNVLISSSDIVDNMLFGVDIANRCSVLPYTDSYSYSLAFLLAWMEVLKFISLLPSQVRLPFVAHLEEKRLLFHLLTNVFRLVPEDKSLDAAGYQNIILDSPPLSTLESSSSTEMQFLAFHVYCCALKIVPATVRTWWNNLEKTPAEAVNKFTSKYISAALTNTEIQAVQESNAQFSNMSVKVRPGAREVIATYSVDDSPIELCIQLPANYPLNPAIAEQKKSKQFVGHQEWRQWVMRLTTVITYQNGSILEGLMAWKKNVDKKFEGVEECMICYYILHTSTGKLPRLSCSTCRKKFHSDCLYRWFQTSNNSTCPLCRNDFA